MVQEMARKTAEKMSDHSVIESNATHIYAYGLELLYSSLAGVLALIIISAVGGKPFLWTPYLAGFVPLRLSGGGYHAKTHFRCIFTFPLLFSFVLLIERMYTIPMKAWLIFCLVNLIIILLFSPVAAPNKPLRECQYRTNRRNSLFLGICNLLGCVVLVFLFNAHNQWINMYYAGSSMAGLSMLLAVIKKRGDGSMKTTVNHAMIKLGALLASAAMFLAISSVSSTCGFMLYQPDVPDELQEQM